MQKTPDRCLLLEPTFSQSSSKQVPPNGRSPSYPDLSHCSPRIRRGLAPAAPLGGPTQANKDQGYAYESGMDPVGDARKPFDIKFYLTAILFLVFDIELLFLYPWAVSLKAPDGVPEAFRPAVLAVLMVLLATLGLAYWVAYRKGVFDWRRK